MKLLVHVLTSGEHTDKADNHAFISEADLQEIADTYNADLHEAPVILGHDSDSLANMPDWAPAFGWVKNLVRNGQKLYAECEIGNQLKQMLDEKLYKKSSVGLYTPASKISPVAGKYYLRHLAMLGAAPPAIKGLEQFQFSEQGILQMGEQDMITADDNASFLAENAGDYLRFILSDGDRGYKGEITNFMPEPSADNNWLYDLDASSFAGQFSDESLGDPQVFDFQIKKDGEGWSKTYKLSQQSADEQEAAESPADEAIPAEQSAEQPISAPDDSAIEPSIAPSESAETSEPMAEAPMAEELEETEDDLAKFSEATREILALKLALSKANRQIAESQAKEQEAFVASLYSEGKLTEGLVHQGDLSKWLVKLDNAESLIFSEGKDLSLQSFAKRMLSALPSLVHFGEIAKHDAEPESADYSSPIGTMADGDGLAIHSKAMAYMSEKGMDCKNPKQYQQALKAILK